MHRTNGKRVVHCTKASPVCHQCVIDNSQYTIHTHDNGTSISLTQFVDDHMSHNKTVYDPPRAQTTQKSHINPCTGACD